MLKMLFSVYTLWAILIAAGLLWPLINNGTIKLL